MSPACFAIAMVARVTWSWTACIDDRSPFSRARIVIVTAMARPYSAAIGETLEGVLRIYLAGEPCLATGGALIRADRLPGRQGRLAFVLLLSERARPVTRDEL